MTHSLRAIARRSIAVAALAACSATAVAVPVDLELSLVIDVSGSVNTTEYNLQMDGYANAFRDATVQGNMLAGANRSIAVNTVFFASSAFSQGNAYTLLDSVNAINAYADLLDNFLRPGSGGTDIADGVERALDLLLGDNGFESTNQVIDVSGDGTSSSTSRVLAQRDRAANAGVTINGLAIESSSTSTRITDYFDANVITDDGFVETASNFDDFENAVLRKLRVETVTAEVSTPTTLPLLALGGLALIAVRRRA